MKVDGFNVSQGCHLIHATHERGASAASSGVGAHGHLGNVHERALGSRVSKHGTSEFLVAAFDASDDGGLRSSFMVGASTFYGGNV
eukprot:CAMPEP_0183765568 /NCGR_PEP_ID=MMETSP0739-20130205/11035_1 /TAXON_ID=385413 /ORGANISM="Thalassiosira miniscula, Strain CCMP1093" /LENGTH=85 /DNA_ID=CAMNT_0026004259 /DNA_START=409 /DNA_END=666 /DNA_ORIENTATION=-